MRTRNFVRPLALAVALSSAVSIAGVSSASAAPIIGVGAGVNVGDLGLGAGVGVGTGGTDNTSGLGITIGVNVGLGSGGTAGSGSGTGTGVGVDAGVGVGTGGSGSGTGVDVGVGVGVGTGGTGTTPGTGTPPDTGVGGWVVNSSALAGADRFETAVAVAKVAAPGTKSAVLASGTNSSPDALAGGPLAKATSSALLLTNRDSLPTPTRDYLIQEGITSVTILGGEPTISANVEKELRDIGISVNNIRRLGGVDRYETSLLIAQQNVFKDATRVFVAGGTSAPDAVSAGGVAGYLKDPIVLVPANDPMYVTTHQQYSAAAKSEVVVLGAQPSVSDSVYTAIGGTERLGGIDRYATSLMIGNWAKNHSVPVTTVSITTAEGTNVVDALSAASLGNVTLLTPISSWSQGVKNYLADNKVTTVHTIGAQSPRM